MGLLKPLALEMLFLCAPSRVLGLCSLPGRLACRDLQKVTVVSAPLPGQGPAKHTVRIHQIISLVN